MRGPSEGERHGLGGGRGRPGPQDDCEDLSQKSVSQSGQWVSLEKPTIPARTARQKSALPSCSTHLLRSIRAHHGLVSLPTWHWDFLLFLQLVEILSGFYLFICGFGDRGMSGGIIDDLSQTKPNFLCFPEPFIILSAVAISFWSQAGQDKPRVGGLGSSP